MPLNYSVRLTVSNEVGASNTSDEKIVSCLYCGIGPDYNVTSKPDNNNVDSTHFLDPQLVLIISIVGSILVAVIIIIIVVILIKKWVKCLKKK